MNEGMKFVKAIWHLLMALLWSTLMALAVFWPFIATWLVLRHPENGAVAVGVALVVISFITLNFFSLVMALHQWTTREPNKYEDSLVSISVPLDVAAHGTIALSALVSGLVSGAYVGGGFLYPPYSGELYLPEMLIAFALVLIIRMSLRARMTNLFWKRLQERMARG